MKGADEEADAAKEVEEDNPVRETCWIECRSPCPVGTGEEQVTTCESTMCSHERKEWKCTDST